MKYLKVILKFILITVVLGLIALIFRSLYRLWKNWRESR